jgi:hypothetical protein
MQDLNAAQQILSRLGAYATPVELLGESDPQALARIKDRTKRRTRPMIGRGNYGKNLRAHFDRERMKARQREQRTVSEQQKLAA